MLCSTSTKTNSRDLSRITSTSKAVKRLAWTSMLKDAMNSQSSTKMAQVTLLGETQAEVVASAETMEAATQVVAAVADMEAVKEATTRVAITIKVMVETKVATKTTTEEVEWVEETAVEAASIKVDTSAMTTETQTQMENQVVASETGAVSRANKATTITLPKTTTTTTWIDLRQLQLNVEEVPEEVETSQEVAVEETRAVDSNAVAKLTITPTRTRHTKRTTTAMQAMVLDSVEEEVVLLLLQVAPKTLSINKRTEVRTNKTTRMARAVLFMSAT